MRDKLKVARVVPVALTLAIVSVPAQAQGDSVYSCSYTHKIKPMEIVIPTAAIGVAALMAGDGWAGELRHDVQDVFPGGGRCKLKVDDYMQYVPMVAVYGLNLCGLKGEHHFWERTAILALAYATMGITVNGIKAAVGEQRPDSPARNSFPSGHTATAFMGAEFLWQEYGRAQPLIGYTGYAVATATGLLRIYNNRHWVNDVVAGAAIGMLSTKFAYWLFPRIFTRHEGKQGTIVTALPSYVDGGYVLNVSVEM